MTQFAIKLAEVGDDREVLPTEDTYSVTNFRLIFDQIIWNYPWVLLAGGFGLSNILTSDSAKHIFLYNMFVYLMCPCFA